MKMRTIIASTVAVAAFGGLGYWGYRRYKAGRPSVATPAPEAPKTETPAEVHTTSHTPASEAAPEAPKTETPETPMHAAAATQSTPDIASVMKAGPLPKIEGLTRQQRRKAMKYFNGFVNTIRTNRWTNTATEIFTLIEHEDRVMVTLERTIDGKAQSVAVMREGSMLTASIDGVASLSPDAITDAIMVMHFAMRETRVH